MFFSCHSLVLPLGIPYEGEQVDVWSLGVVLYTMVTGRMPYDDSNMKDLVRQVKQGVHFTRPKQPLTDTCKDIIRGMLTLDPKERLTIAAIMGHPWLRSKATPYIPPPTEPKQNE